MLICVFRRHTQYSSTDTVPYRLTVDTVDYGNITVPQLSTSLYLTRRDSKIHVSDYQVGDYNLLYSTAEIFTWYVFPLERRPRSSLLNTQAGNNTMTRLYWLSTAAQTSTTSSRSRHQMAPTRQQVASWRTTLESLPRKRMIIPLSGGVYPVTGA